MFVFAQIHSFGIIFTGFGNVPTFSIPSISSAETWDFLSFLTVLYIDFQFPFGRIYLVTGYYSPQKGSFAKQYFY